MKFLEPTPPDLPLDLLADVLRSQYGLRGTMSPFVSERDQNVRVDSGADSFLFKVCNADEAEEVVDLQVQALRHIEHVDPTMPVPRAIPTASGDDIGRVVSPSGVSHLVRLMTYLDGVVVDRRMFDTPEFRRQAGVEIARMDRALRGFFHPGAHQDHPWLLMGVPRLLDQVGHIADEDVRRSVVTILEHARDHTIPACSGLRHQVIHQDAHTSNLVVDPARPFEVAGIIDFGDMGYCPLIVELAVASHLSGRPDPSPSTLIDTVLGFDSVTPLEEDEVDVLYDLVLARIAMNVTIVAARQQLFPTAHSLRTDQTILSTRLQTALEAERDVTSQLRRVLGFSAATGSPSTTKLQKKRTEVLGAYSPHFYTKPLHVTGAAGMWMSGADGKQYLDFYNNVPTVGHNHPQVVNAISRQLATLNTNTRYLYSTVVEYAEELTATLEHDLDVCLFVNSGSEANDVASQILQRRAGVERLLVMEDSYHGITEATLSLTDSGNTPSTNVTAINFDFDVDSTSEPVAGFFVDPALTSSGIPNVPVDFFKRVADSVRHRGGLVVADEVQSGFGRMGVMWGHQQQQFVPDVVTMGKPAGNGQPLGVVITRNEILTDFMQHAGLFSTFGGNPVSTAAGLAVLDVIERERLVENSAHVGAYLKGSLNRFGEGHSMVAEVRGSGLLVGIELTLDASETRRILEMMREAGVLVGATGGNRNVLKLRPPLIARPEHVDQFIEALTVSVGRL